MRRAIQVDGDRIISCVDFQHDENLSDFIQYSNNHEIDIIDGTNTGDIVDGYYFPDNTLTKKPVMAIAVDKTEIYANAVDSATIAGVPTGAVISSGDTTSTADGTDIIFTTDTRGVHVITFKKSPYLDAEVTINAI